MRALRVILLAALKELRCARSVTGQQTAEGDFVLYDRVGESVAVTLPMTKMLESGADSQELRRSKVIIHFECLGDSEEMRWESSVESRPMSAEELMEELVKACQGEIGGHPVSLIVLRTGWLSLSVRTLTTHRHVPLRVDAGKMTRQQLAKALEDARKALSLMTG